MILSSFYEENAPFLPWKRFRNPPASPKSYIYRHAANTNIPYNGRALA